MENRALIHRRKYIGKPGLLRQKIDQLEELEKQEKKPSLFERTKSFFGSFFASKPEPLQKCMKEDEKVEKQESYIF